MTKPHSSQSPSKKHQPISHVVPPLWSNRTQLQLIKKNSQFISLTQKLQPHRPSPSQSREQVRKPTFLILARHHPPHQLALQSNLCCPRVPSTPPPHHPSYRQEDNRILKEALTNKTVYTRINGLIITRDSVNLRSFLLDHHYQSPNYKKLERTSPSSHWLSMLVLSQVFATTKANLFV